MHRKTFVLAGLIAVILTAAVVYMIERPRHGDEFARLMNLGKNYYDQGDTAKAVDTFHQAVAKMPTSRDGQLNLANAYLLHGDAENAITTAQEAINLDNNLAAAHYVKGCALLRLSKFQDAVKELQTSYELDPTVAAAPFQLGRAHAGLEQSEEAITAFRDAIALQPEHPAAHYALSQALVRSGKQAEATQELELHRQIAAKQGGAPPTAATYERSKHTLVRATFKLEQPDKKGISVRFVDATSATLGANARNYHGPVGVIDFNHDGKNNLFVGEGEGFRVLANQNSRFSAQGEQVPGVPGSKYFRCLVGDLQNDRYDDIVVVGDKGTKVFKCATNGAITDVSTMTRLNDVAGKDAALVDLDFTGKLDLCVVTPTNTVELYRNLGNLYFRNQTATSGIPVSLQSAGQLVVEDWNNDDIMDLIVARRGQPPLLLNKIRGGPLSATNSPGDWPGGSVFAMGDLNNDLRADLVVATSAGIEIVFGGTGKRTTIPFPASAVHRLALIDYDNDGWLDVMAIGPALHVWRNRGEAGFVETTAALGLDKMAGLKAEDISVADFDGDGDSDLVVTTEGQGLVYLRNDGGNANQQLKLRLFGNRSNASGLGVKVEVSAGGLRLIRTVTQTPVEIGVGSHPQLDSVTVHWFDLADNILDVKLQKEALTFFELQLPTGSCPFLYAWDGKHFRFVSDILGAAPVGLRLSDARFIDADPEEYVWIGTEQMFPSRNGEHVLQVTEELREILYLDQAKLIAVDHPAGTEIHTTGKLLPGKPFPKSEFVTLHRRHQLLRASRSDGLDVTQALQERDENFCSPVKLRIPQLRGLAEPYSVTLDFGALEMGDPLVLALTGWLRFGGGMANVAASHNPELPFPFPTIEVEASDGTWKPLDVIVGAPAGKTKTILVDLSGKLPRGSRRLRLSTAFEIHWDRVALFEKAGEQETLVRTLAPAGADLHWRGFSQYEDRPWTQPLTPNYEDVRASALWRITPGGWVTRYGAINQLIAKQDNALALVNSGDELTLRFPSAALPPKPAGNERDFFFFSVGWDKDADFHVEQGWAVGPLPFTGMDDQRYGVENRPSFPNDALMQEYNTRWAGPITLSRNRSKATSR